jgi:asparagine synthetase B (glutamine-hydrolysing)
MCGIFGIVLRNASAFPADDVHNDLKRLYRSSMARGQDATGLAINNGASIGLIRRDCKPTQMIAGKEFRQTVASGLEGAGSGPILAVGQCRLVTNGSLAIADNNQPIAVGDIVGVHNGIVVNDQDLLKTGTAGVAAPARTKSAEAAIIDSDTRNLMIALDRALADGTPFPAALHAVFQKIEGEASVAIMPRNGLSLGLATNTGSLYVAVDADRGLLAFASERIFLRDLIANGRLFQGAPNAEVEHLGAGDAVIVSAATFDIQSWNMITGAPANQDRQPAPPSGAESVPIVNVVDRRDNLVRCTKCVLPHTYPGISFDDKGVCNFCREHEHQKFHGRDALEQLLSRYRRNNGEYDCLVGLSGGRDSCYGMHVLKKEFGMTPLAYTYDWGLTTDQSRRNQAIICSKLGIEHVIRAPDIAKKRRHIRKNINAWLKHPEMGMVPLFMAGDKDFYQFGRTLKRHYGIDLTVFCSGYLLEQRQFFVGFCGVHDRVTYTARLYDYPLFVKMKLAMYYVGQYARNPAYINESFFDSVKSFFTGFLLKDDFLYLFEYLKWDEAEIEKVLKEEYGWQSDAGYGTNQWRMGDGQTAFTNYIFHTVAGFSEFDNFRSNQIREGLLERDEAMRLIEQDNQPKWGALEYFGYVVGINLDEILARVNNVPKLY